MRVAWLIVALSGLSACGTELSTDDVRDADVSDTFEVDVPDGDTGDSHEDVDTLEDLTDGLEDLTDGDAHDTDTFEDSSDTDTLEDLSDIDILEDTDTLEDLSDTDTLEDLSDTVEDLSDTDTLEDLSDTDTLEDLSDTDTLEDTEEEIDTVDNPCRYPSGILNDRYAPMANLYGADLRAALSTFVSQGSVGFDYDVARDFMYGITDTVDVGADSYIECVYTGFRALADGTRSPGSGQTEITTEHSWPRSDGAGNFPAEGDMHHLFPALAPANNSRGNYEFGDVACGIGWPRGCTWGQGGSFLGPSVDGRNNVFEVRPQHRGDIARAHFYFSVRYGRQIPANEEATLRRWHCEDPPSPAERARNAKIEVHQKNRNPFVDQPFWVDRIVDY